MTIRAGIVAIIAIAAFFFGWLANGWRLGINLAEMQMHHQAEQSRRAQEAISVLSAANKRADQLALNLAAAENTREKLTQEKDREIRRLTVGRRCLDGAVVRVLNDPGGGVSKAPGRPVRTNADFATDTDVGEWIGQCQRGYETCRGRLGAIAEFYENEGAKQ